MYVGSFTAKDGGRGEGLSVYQRNPKTQTWTLVQLLKDLADPSFLILDRAGRHVYSAHGDGTQVTAYKIDEATGRLIVLNRQPTSGTNGVHLAIDGTDRFLALANYATGSLALFPVNQDGSLGALTDLATMKGEPGPHRTQQESPHPHDCPFDRTGRYIVVPDKGLDRIFLYRLDAARGKLTPGDPPHVVARAGAAPRHVAFHPTRPFAYVINELDSTMATYEFEPDKGVLKPVQILPTTPSTYTGNNTGAEVVVAPSGRFVYGSNRGHNSIAIFAIDDKTGLLSSVGWAPTQGSTPRFFALDPSGAQLYAANQGTNTIVVFDVNQATGKLTPTGETVKVMTPTSIAFK
ncbi:MAG TPA: lactonase family protein [Vicinamibacterales bacterium]|jgi:6-phosphogluconolactonase|nr:lactonase family protein [Vicinamibacterales bacterium]